jgi:carboxyl-terminal processing protease
MLASQFKTAPTNVGAVLLFVVSKRYEFAANEDVLPLHRAPAFTGIAPLFRRRKRCAVFEQNKFSLVLVKLLHVCLSGRRNRRSLSRATRPICVGERFYSELLMKLKTRAPRGAMLVLALGAAFGAGYSTRSLRPRSGVGPKGSPRTSLSGAPGDDNRLAQRESAAKGTRAYKPDLRPYETLDEVRRAIKENFVKTQVDDTEITYGAVRGMLRALGDRFTRFMTPEDYNEFLVSNKGEFVGIGARIDVKDDYAGSPLTKPFGASRPYIVEPIAGGPASKQGLKRGDVILSIDGRTTADMSEDATVSYIRGKQGTPVKLKIERKLNAPKNPKETKYDIFDIELTRDLIEMHPVTLEWLPGDVAWLKLDEFNEKTDAEFGAAIKQIKAGRNGASTKGIVFDMRSNPGGLLTAAVDVGSRFVQSGPIVITRERGGAERSYSAETNKFANLKIPLWFWSISFRPRPRKL